MTVQTNDAKKYIVSILYMYTLPSGGVRAEQPNYIFTEHLAAGY